MRSVVVATLGLSLAGCATVSVTPSDTAATAEASAQQSALRQASDLFCEKAEAEGWVSTTPGILGLASILMNGGSDNAEPVGTYADRIDAGTAIPSDVLARIAADATSARGGLIAVEAEAQALIASEGVELARSDVMAFERALVRAQRSNRGFREALEIVSERSEANMEAVTSIEAFAEIIDRASATADALTTTYTSRRDGDAAKATS